MKKLAGLFLLCFNVNNLIDFRMFTAKSIYYLYIVFSFTLLFPYASITGKVTDINSAEPLVGVNVVLEGTSYGSSTDIDGEYIIENVPLDDYTLKIMYIGYKNKEISISIDEEKKYIYKVELSESEIALEETNVTAFIEREEKKTEAPATIETVDSKDIEQAATSNLGGFLQGMKGVDFTASGVNNYSLSIRGFNSSFSSRLLMLTDGRPANVPSLRVVNFSTVPSTQSDIEKIEVVLGPATASIWS